MYTFDGLPRRRTTVQLIAFRYTYVERLNELAMGTDKQAEDAEILLLPVSVNKRPPYWNVTSDLQSGRIVRFSVISSIIV